MAYHFDMDLTGKMEFVFPVEIVAPPETSYDETKIALIELDENDEATENVTYVDTARDAAQYVYNNSGINFLVRVGSQCAETSIGSTQSFSYRENLKRVEIYNDTTLISDSCFYGSGLKQIKLPDTLATIQVNAFSGSALESLTMPDSVTTLGTRICGECTELKSVKVSAGLATLTQQAFQDCTALVDVTIPNGVQSIGMMAFNSCSSLASLEIPASVTEIGMWCFSGATALTTITIHKPENSISGAPWGATNATVIWTG